MTIIDKQIKNVEKDNNKLDVNDDDDGFGVILSKEKLKSDHFNAIIPKKDVLIRQRSEEEIVGQMRYIYEVDANGNRKFIRRKSLSKISGTGHSLQ